VIYWLAGFTGTGATLFQGGQWQPSLAERLDRLVAAGEMDEVIVVAPDCFTRLGGSQYIDSPATGRYETHLCRELIPEIDGRFRTAGTRAGRGIGGKSSGGFGALVLAMRHPDLFAAVASHAGDAYFELSVLKDIPQVFRTLRRHGGVDGFLRHFDAAPVKRSEDITAMTMLACAAAYAPDGERPGSLALPFDLETGEIVAEVWRRFKVWDPVEMVAAHAEALRSLLYVYVDAGTRDEHALDLGARVLVSRMRALGIAVVHEEFDDGHMGTAYRYEVSLPRMARVLARATAEAPAAGRSAAPRAP
jgi:enterochelin esterase family protein